MALDFKKMVEEIVEKSGGKENIISVGHCFTRLRIVVHNIKAVDQNAIKEINGVIGVVYQAGQLQIIMGKNLQPAYDEMIRRGFKEGGAVEEKNDDVPQEKKTIPQRIMEYIVASVTPTLSFLIPASMVKVFMLIFAQFIPGFEGSSTYTMLNCLANAAFYFMPVWIASCAAKKLGATPGYVMVVMAASIGTDFMNIVNAGAAASMFGINVPLGSYGNLLLPALLTTYVAYWAEKLIDKVIPGILKPIIVGAGVITITFTLNMTVLSPLGAFVGTYVVSAFMWLYGIAGPLALAILAGCLPFLIMTGMHSVFGPFMIQLLSERGYDPFFRPSLLLHNVCEGAAMLGIALRAKDKAVKTEAFSLAISCIFAGVTEPTIYGFALPLKKPLIAVSAGGGVGGLIAGLLHVHNYELGYSTVLALPIFEDTMIGMLIAIAAAFAVTCVLTMILGFDEEMIKKNL